MSGTTRFPSTQGWTRALVATLVVGGCVCAPGCLRRDVSTEQPTTKISYETAVPQPAIDKIDLLFVIDNSPSMADKQRILADAIPDLVRGVVEPRCVDKKTRAPTGVVVDPTKADAEQCPSGSEPAFTPVTDMHVGVISTSIGAYLVQETDSAGQKYHRCAPESPTDDRGHLLARAEGGGAVPEAGDVHFLSFYPDVAANQDKRRHPDPPGPKMASLDALSSALNELVRGVGQKGCGLEAQLESAYRFLVEPDPWKEVAIVDGRATYSGIDDELLRQRAAFLRPDSLVAVVMLTDEEDASVDPLAFQGTGRSFLEAAPRKRGTVACEADPSSSACTSCEFAPADPACARDGGRYLPDEDQLNVRFTSQMKHRFGVEPRFSTRRYVDGFTSPKVPARAREADASGDGGPACTNPLFAAALPARPGDDTCKLPRGPRSPQNVYFAVIGGVPPQLLPSDPAAELDWTRILGRDPDKFDTWGIDPHMIASTRPRAGLPPPGAESPDPIHGREWTTGDLDLQYACTFDLYKRVGERSEPMERVCDAEAARNRACDCDGKSDSPLCNPHDRSKQIKGKAYPTIRELTVARDLGERGIAASLCPIQLKSPEAEDYGYRPAVRRIADRLERGRIGACVPRRLEREDAEGNVSCIVLAMLEEGAPESDCARFGLAPPSPEILAQTRARLAEEEGEAAARRAICTVPQIPVPPGQTCREEESAIAFCYAENVAGPQCGNALVFTKPTERLAGARFMMQCIQLRDRLPTALAE